MARSTSLADWRRRWTVSFWPGSTTPKERLYGFLAGALIRGTMNRLKVCRHCGKYIVVRDIKREFCPDTNCKNDFFNALKTAWAKQNKVDSLLPRAVQWVEELERDILAAGRVLTPEEIAIAQRVGVAQPERIRIRSVKTIAAPRDPELAEAAEKAGLCWATMSGLTAFYGIMLVEGDYTRELLAHECYHVRQYEEHGSIANFLEEYISQVLVWGYGDARLERDAREVARGYELTLR